MQSSWMSVPAEVVPAQCQYGEVSRDVCQGYVEQELGRACQVACMRGNTLHSRVPAQPTVYEGQRWDTCQMRNRSKSGVLECSPLDSYGKTLRIEPRKKSKVCVGAGG